MFKKLSWTIPFLLFGIVIVYVVNSNATKHKQNEKIKNEELQRRDSITKLTISSIVLKWSPNENWIESLRMLENTRRYINPIFSIELEKLLVNGGAPTLFLCNIINVENIDETHYQVSLKCFDFKHRHMFTKINLVLIADKQIIDNILREKDIWDQKNLVVIALIKMVKGKDQIGNEGNEIRTHVCYGHLLDLSLINEI